MKSTYGSDRVLHAFTAYGRGGGSARVRVFDWLDRLDIPAVTHSYAGLNSNTPQVLRRHPGAAVKAECALRLTAATRRFPRVLVSKQATPFSAGGIESRLLRRAGWGVYDVDDSLLDEVGRRTGGLFDRAAAFRRSVRSADRIIAGNDYLADQAAHCGALDICVIPSCVDPAHYVTKTDYDLGSFPRAVWIGSHSTERFLAGITTPLLRLHESHGLRLTVISAGMAPLGELDVMVDRVGWSGEAAAHLASFDVGVMPLPDTPQTRGKCAYKLLQYAAAALPSVASPVGANREALDRGLGLAAETPEQWHDALGRIIEDSAQSRRSAGRAALQAVTQGYSFAAWQQVWLNAVGGA